MTPWNKRQYIWQHNGLRGSAVLVQKVLQNIADGPSTTPQAKQLANAMLLNIYPLQDALKTRVDHK